MCTHRILTARITLIACLLSGSAAFGADDGRRQSDDTSAPEPLFYYAFTGANADDVKIPEALVGDGLIMVYQHQFGLYPFINAADGQVFNGGVPERANIAAHLRKLARDIDRLIPDPEYDGYVVIDYEGWRPFWDDTAGWYKDLSRELVRRKNPGWDEARVERKARVGFEAAAKKLLKRTLDKCHAMRPKAKWGIYSYPKANMRDNDARWLWDRHDAFFPEIYMRNSLVPDDVEPGLGEEHERDYIAYRLVARVEFAREIAGDRPVLPVVWPRYTEYNPNQWLRLHTLKQSDLALCLEGPFNHGADGVVIWENIPQPGLAKVFQKQIDDSIAPELRRILTDRGMPIDDTLAGSDNDDPEVDDGDTVPEVTVEVESSESRKNVRRVSSVRPRRGG